VVGRGGGWCGAVVGGGWEGGVVGGERGKGEVSR